ncbi:hypothetical protein HanXRQr2_Chr01g0016361 [Helianthus annuus]|uniref:Uncharacterized protein n=1 Tax=Helianthus annuus TaxID=4232 RepID=A0A9K3JUH6_HELAN|nr:hypothetical protein HanXRQr2_Chr01g0016361 [Helianthus annuus]KAJ0956514.1 hypothetical protein HanPSC8_Chr01g0015681 [Helianthus annuus]
MFRKGLSRWVFFVYHFDIVTDSLFYSIENRCTNCDSSTGTFPCRRPTATLVTQIICMFSSNKNLFNISV